MSERERLTALQSDVRIVDFVHAGHFALLRWSDKPQRAYRAMGSRVAAMP